MGAGVRDASFDGCRPIEPYWRTHVGDGPLNMTKSATDSPSSEQALHHLEGDNRAEAVPADVVRALGLHGAQLGEVVRRHLLDGPDRRRSAVQAPHLQAVERLLLPEQPRERLEVEHRARTSVDAEDRRLGSVRLNRYERRPATRAGVALEQRRELLDGRRLKERTERERVAELALEPREEPRGDDRRDAEIEEVVGDAHGRDAELLLPHRDEALLERGTRREIRGGLRALQDGRRQRFAVDLAVGRERESVEHDDRGRHHVRRQRLRHVLPKLVARRRRAVGVHDVADNAHVARNVLASDRNSSGDSFVPGESGFDLAELDPVSAHLHLVVEASEKLDLAALVR